MWSHARATVAGLPSGGRCLPPSSACQCFRSRAQLWLQALAPGRACSLGGARRRGDACGPAAPAVYAGVGGLVAVVRGLNDSKARVPRLE